MEIFFCPAALLRAPHPPHAYPHPPSLTADYRLSSIDTHIAPGRSAARFSLPDENTIKLVAATAGSLVYRRAGRNRPRKNCHISN